MAKSVITRKRGFPVGAIVEVDGVRVGTAHRCDPCMGAPGWWNFNVDQEYRFQDKALETHATAGRVREAALAAYSRVHATNAAIEKGR